MTSMHHEASFERRIAFVVELGRRLHEYGTSAQRLEAAVEGVSRSLQLSAQLWSNPTGMIFSFSDQAPGADPTNEVSRIIRLPPGDNHLARLADTDDIAERVLSGELELESGLDALRALQRPLSRRARVLGILAFSLTAAGVAGLLLASRNDVISAALVGLLVGLLADFASVNQRFAESFEAVSALVATLVAGLIGAYFWPITPQTVVVGAMIVLMPGLTLTNAVNELAANHWVSGSARFAGAATALMKLAFGALVGDQILAALGVRPLVGALPHGPAWLEWVSLVVVGVAFGVLFRAHLRDYPLVMGAAFIGYLVTRFGGAMLGSEIGVFLAGFAISATSNIYARLRNRPGALVRLPGIILLVPGSVGFRSLSFMFERDFNLGFDTGITLLTVLVALVAGLLFGNLMIASRRSL